MIIIYCSDILYFIYVRNIELKCICIIVQFQIKNSWCDKDLFLHFTSYFSVICINFLFNNNNFSW